MAGDDNVARVYARALYDAAREAGRVESVRRDMGAFAEAVATSRPLRDVLLDPQIDAAAKRRVLSELCRSGDKLVANTLHVLLDKGRMALVAEVQAELEAQAVVEAAVVEVEVTSAVDLHAEAETALVRRLEEALGRRVSLVKKVRPEIIGGLVLRVGDRVADATVLARIHQLRRRLETADPVR
jgi:F-type H+-transporting ATPase subunit delta